MSRKYGAPVWVSNDTYAMVQRVANTLDLPYKAVTDYVIRRYYARIEPALEGMEDIKALMEATHAKRETKMEETRTGPGHGDDPRLAVIRGG